jgi:photosystem II stability/assembly factor-like uncharacterized protein
MPSIRSRLAAVTAQAARVTGRCRCLTRIGRVIGQIRPPVLATLTVVVVAALGLVSPGLASAQSSGWTLQLPISSRSLSSLSCASPSNCVAVGSNGIVATTDGGTTWVDQTVPGGPLDLTGVSCAVATSCVAVGSGTILATSDSGKTWAVQAPPAATDFLSSVSCSSTMNCTAVGQDGTTLAAVIITTTNGGTTWTAETAPPGVGYIHNVSCPTAKSCFAVVTHGIIATTNGGTTWVMQSAPATTAPPLDVSCSSAQVCLVVGSGLILATTNGGTTWVTQTPTSGTPDLTSVSCASAGDCWAVGTDVRTAAPAIIATTDGGATWTSQDASAAPFGLSAVSCVNALDCWSVSQTYSASAIIGTTDGGVTTPPPPPPPPPAAVQFVTTLPLDVTVGKLVTATLGIFTYPQATPALPGSAFTATIDWGDGTTSTATIKNTTDLNTLYPGRDGYAVKGMHRYLTSDPTTIKITVTHATEPPQSVLDQVNVEALDPLANFVSAPSIPHQGRDTTGGLTNGSIALLIPASPTPLQRPVAEYKWEFGDGSTVYDFPSEHAIYGRVLRQLAANPGSGGLLTQAINLGILPPGADGGPFGIGGLAADEVRTVVKVWQQEFPLHIVPHIYPDYGTVGVRLTVTDISGATSQSVQNLTVSRDCQQWGGNGVFGFNPFAGYTTCDTLAGIQSQFGPRRPRDYIFLGASKSLKLPSVLAKLGLGAAGSVQLVVTHGVLAQFPSANTLNSVFIQLQLTAGVGVKLPSTDGLSGGEGWLGPPDAAQPPPSDADINNFVNGFTYSAGASAGFAGYGIGYNMILNTNPVAGGEEWYFGSNTGLSASVGGSCAAPIPVASSNAWSLLQSLFKTISQTPPNPDASIIIPQLAQAWNLLFGTSVDVLTSIGHALAQCAGISS